MTDVIDDNLDDVFLDGYDDETQAEIDSRLMLSCDQAKKTVHRFIIDEFLTEAMIAATNLRNLLGDADGNAFDLAEHIRSNLLVVAMGIKKDPGEYILAAARTIDDIDERKMFLTSVIDKINNYLNEY